MDKVVLKHLTISISGLDFQSVEQKPVTKSEPVGYNNVDLVCEILGELEAVEDQCAGKESENDNLPEIQELMEILYGTDFQSLMEAHDLVANKTFEPSYSEALVESAAECPFPGPESNESGFGRVEELQPANGTEDGIRLVGLRRGLNSNLQGMTVRSENGQLVIARILVGSPVDKQGLLHVGDIIQEVNGHAVRSSAALQQAVLCQPDTVFLRIIPSWNPIPRPLPVFYKAHFSYDPRNDPLLPASSIGLKFSRGDILEVLNVDDDVYWQARRYGETGSATLVPSQTLQEQRIAKKTQLRKGSMRPKKFSLFPRAKKKEVLMYGNRQNLIDIDRHELAIYEEVLKVPAFPRKAVILIGPLGTARRSLVNKLIKMFPERYGYPLPRTSRPPRPGEQNGRQYFFNTLDEMKRDIAANQYAEFGEYAGNLYGTKLDSIRYTIMSGKTCVLDCSPQCLKMLRTKEFLPFVAFVAAPTFAPKKSGSTNGSVAHTPGSEMRSLTVDDLKAAANENGVLPSSHESRVLLETYESLVDLVLHGSDVDECFQELMMGLTRAELEDQWIPVAWIY